MSTVIRIATVAIAFLAVSVTPAQGRELTFDDRVAAQEAIERIYYSHQIGASRPFEEAVPRAFLEAKVRDYLRQTVALEKIWNTQLTDEMLQRELERIASGTRLPERLIELYAALNDDLFLIKECVARQVLVDRLTRNFSAFDNTIHAATRARAEELRRQLVAGDLDPGRDHPDRSVVELAVRPSDAGDPSEERPPRPGTGRGDRLRIELSPEKFRERRARMPRAVGGISPIEETRDSILVRAVLSETESEIRVADYTLPKKSWGEWWLATEAAMDHRHVAPIATEHGSVPAPGIRQRPADGSVVPSGGPCGDDLWDNGILDDVPGLRDRHTAVWTGSLMVVWGGGAYGANDLSTGGRYDPLTDTWKATSLTGAPSGRARHAAVWTGDVMVVWGGYDGNRLDTGGRYNPLTDTWKPTSLTGAPCARRGHTAVWTGSRMVVWGGSGDAGYLDDGGRYDPRTDTWTATSTAGAPSKRQSHTAVWTGNLMVVWGGLDSGSYLMTGGRYDPLTDTWTATSTTGAPSWRLHHTAVWTGSVMVVWGGYSGMGYLDTGGRYDPLTDTWTATSLTGAPHWRQRHTAVWTGNLMVVWGGWGGGYLNTGSRYVLRTSAGRHAPVYREVVVTDPQH